MERTFTFFENETETETDSDDDADSEGEGRVLKVRLDKWLWAARFFKTRALARLAVENKKIGYWINGQQISKLSPSREVEVGATLTIQHGRFTKMVIVKGLSTRRRNTEEALQLFEETEVSRRMREKGMSEQAVYGFSHTTGNRFRDDED
jgi:ribosome-associated heat shock protein Hsp15